MLIENHELTLGHVGLGALTEVALMNLFATCHSHCITAGTGHSIREITTEEGDLLYPGYYWTSITVPPGRLLNRHRVWDTVSIGAHALAFGSIMLDSVYVMGEPGEIPEDPDRWCSSDLPSMRGSNMFTIDQETGAPRPAAPREGSVAALPKKENTPESLDRFRKVRAGASIEPDFRSNLKVGAPIRYSVAEDRDAAPGHNLMFSTFASITDRAEWMALSRQVLPGFSSDLLECRQLLERETFYFENCRAGEEISVHVSARLDPPSSDLSTISEDLIYAAALSFLFEVYNTRDNSLLTLARAKKALMVPWDRPNLLHEVERILTRCQ